MNIIEEQRKQIIDNNNNGQERLKNIIENMNKTSQELVIAEPLNGDIDLEILKTFNLKSLSFSQGNITSIKNIPNKLKKLEVPENLLIKIEDLPNSLEHLNINHNYLNDLAFDDLPVDLKYVNISHNYFERIDMLPPNIEEFNCSNNKITYLNLYKLTKLETLDITHNMVTIIDNYPDTIINFYNENNPSIQYRETDSIPKESSKKNKAQDYNIALKKYFQYKTKYEGEILKKKRELFKSTPSKKERILRIHNFKPRCIYCKRNVGTIFEKVDNTYKAYCGSATDPCKLNIEIYASDFMNLYELLNAYHDEINNLRDRMIQHKMNSLFNYDLDSEISKNFEEDYKEFELTSTVYKELNDKYYELFFDKKDKAMMEKLNTEIFEFNEEFNTLMEEYKKTNKFETIREAMRIYTEQIYPLHKQLYNLKFKVIEILDENQELGLKHKYRLNVLPTTISDLDFPSGELPSVKHFEV
jgi:hypothetical protein